MERIIKVLFLFCATCLLSIRKKVPAYRTSIHKVAGDYPRMNDMLKQNQIRMDNSEYRELQHNLIETARPRGLKWFKKEHRASSDEEHTAVIAIKQNNLSLLEQILNDVSNPFSLNYGNYLTHSEILQFTHNPEAIAAVYEFLNQNDLQVTKKSSNHEYIQVKGPVKVWERVLNTKMFVFSHIENKNYRVIRCEEYSLPSYLSDHVVGISNLVQFPDNNLILKQLKRSNPKGSRTIQSVNDYVTPQLINKVYNISSNIGNALTSQALYETIEQSYSPSDLSMFQSFFHIPLQTVAVDIGGHNHDQACRAKSDNCVEANLDVQYMMAVAQHIPTTYYYWGGQDFLLDWSMEVADMVHPPSVFSISYGSDESEMTETYMLMFNIEAIKLSLKGVTLVAASGDDGVAGASARQKPLECGYRPQFPVTSPYVTAVGGTMGPETRSPEVSAQSNVFPADITSGGGFSELVDAPSWQQTEIKNYFKQAAVEGKNVLPGYSQTGRGYPDISALSINYVIALSGNFTFVSGTSASSPVVAGMIALVNSARASSGRPSLGWVNPALYALSAQFVNDIVEGDNRCVAVDTVCCSQGFFATKGWDPVTGLGTLNFGKFLETMNSNATNQLNTSTNSPSTPPAPTASPTIIPIQDPGWFYINTYSAPNCGGDVTTVTGFPTRECLIEYNADGEPIGSTQFYCAPNFAFAISYNDTVCEEILNFNKYFLGCALEVNNYYETPHEHTYSMDIACKPSPLQDLPLPDNGRNYAVISGFNSQTGCDENTISTFDAFLNGYCFNQYDKGVSSVYQFPHFLEYEQLSCSAHRPSATTVLSESCAAVEVSSGNSYGSSSYSYSYSYGNSYSEDISTNLFEKWSMLSVQSVPTLTPTLGRTSSMPSITFTNLPTSSMPSIKSTIPSSSSIPTALNTTTFTSSRFPTIQPTQNVTARSVPSVVPSVLYPSHFPVQTLNPTFQPPHGIPSAAPSVFNQSAPTNFNQSVPYYNYSNIITLPYFKVTQLLMGIDVRQYLLQRNHNELAIKLALAKIMSVISIYDVLITSISDPMNHVDFPTNPNQDRRRLFDGSFPSLRERTCNVTYWIFINTTAVGFPDVDTSFQYLRLQLSLGITTHRFDSYIRDFAQQLSATYLQFAHSSSVVVSSTYTYLDPVTITSKTSDDEVSTPESKLKAVEMWITVSLSIGFAIGMIVLVILFIYRKQLSQRIFGGQRYNQVLEPSEHPTTTSQDVTDSESPTGSSPRSSATISPSMYVNSLFGIQPKNNNRRSVSDYQINDVDIEMVQRNPQTNPLQTHDVEIQESEEVEIQFYSNTSSK